MKKKFVTNIDHPRLVKLTEMSSARMPEVVEVQCSHLPAAKMIPQENIASSVVTMNSRVRLKEPSNDREIELTVTDPQDADNLNRKVSVLSPRGVALLGHRSGDRVSWKVPGGVGTFEIVKVTYQPEAEGGYSL